MGWFSKITGALSGVLNVIKPLAMFTPFGPAVMAASMAANVATGLTQSPPTGVESSAVH